MDLGIFQETTQLVTKDWGVLKHIFSGGILPAFAGFAAAIGGGFVTYYISAPVIEFCKENFSIKRRCNEVAKSGDKHLFKQIAKEIKDILDMHHGSAYDEPYYSLKGIYLRLNAGLPDEKDIYKLYQIIRQDGFTFEERSIENIIIGCGVTIESGAVFARGGATILGALAAASFAGHKVNEALQPKEDITTPAPIIEEVEVPAASKKLQIVNWQEYLSKQSESAATKNPSNTRH